MKNVCAWGVFVLGLIFAALLVGCGGVSSRPSPTPTPTPKPSPMPSPTPTPAAHGTFIFVSGVATSGQPTDGYRLNSDGTLTQIPGSPFAFNGLMAASGGFLMVASTHTLTSYKVDPATGIPSIAGNAVVSSTSAITADAQDVYVAGTTPDNTSNVIYSFSIAGSGALTPLSGSPFLFGGACFFCDNPDSLAVNKNFLAVGGVGFHSVGDFSVFPRSANGTLGNAQGLGTDEQGAVAIQHPTGNVAFAIDGSLGAINSYHIDSTGKPAAGSTLFSGTSGFMDEIIDATGKFLLSVDSSGVVHVFTIDSATAAFSQIGTSESAGNGALQIAMDPSGRFVIVTQSSNQATPPPPDQITVFTFDPASGAMKKLQSYPVGKLPFRIAIVTE